MGRLGWKDWSERSYSSSFRVGRPGSMNTGAEVWDSVCKTHQVLSLGVWVTEGNTEKKSRFLPVATTSRILHAKTLAQWFRSIIFRKEKLVCVCTYWYWKECNHRKLPRIDSSDFWGCLCFHVLPFNIKITLGNESRLLAQSIKFCKWWVFNKHPESKETAIKKERFLLICPCLI